MSDELTFAIAQIIGVPEDHVKPSSSLEADLGLDPFDTAELVMELEDRYGSRLVEVGPHERSGCEQDVPHLALETVADVERLLSAPSERAERVVAQHPPAPVEPASDPTPCAASLHTT